MEPKLATSETMPQSIIGNIAAPRLSLTVERENERESDRSVTVDGDFVRIGSHESNDLVLDDPKVSRFHCRLTRSGSAWRLADAGSLNGTRIGGVLVRDADLIAQECRIELGDSVVLVREEPAERSYEYLDRPSFGDLYGRSTVMRRLYASIERIARSDDNVLIEGESGTGKELVAIELVRRGLRARAPFVIVDCSAIAPSLLESELFGHVRGANEEAERDRVGAFQAAHGGTVFLDEIGDLPLELQPKLLRALEAREIQRIGDNKPCKIDVRVVAATSRRLDREVNQGRFREDLYFRLSKSTLRVPPLRERLDDLELLTQVILSELGASREAHLFTAEVLDDWARYDWPGNVRELRNFIERSVVLQAAAPAAQQAREPGAGGEPPIDLDLSFKAAKNLVTEHFERRYLTALLQWAEGNVSRAARKAQMDRMNLYRLMQRYGLKEPSSLKD